MSDGIEILRRMVLSAPDGFSDPIRATLAAMGYSGGSWAKVTGNAVAVFVGGEGAQPAPDLGTRLVADLGGNLSRGWSPGDSWWEWHWTAPLDPGLDESPQ